MATIKETVSQQIEQYEKTLKQYKENMELYKSEINKIKELKINTNEDLNLKLNFNELMLHSHTNMVKFMQEKISELMTDTLL